VQGNVCWSVMSSDASGLVMYHEPLFNTTQRVYFKLS